MFEESKVRVVVVSGDATTLLGLGTKVGRDTVYAFTMPSGTIVTRGDPLVEPDDETKEDMAKQGAKLLVAYDNPVIDMDDGRRLYGCQIWWKPVTPNEEYVIIRDSHMRSGGNNGI